MKKRKYRKKIKIRVLKRRKKRYPKRIQKGKGIFSDGFNILKSLGKTYYHALGGKWEEKKLCYGKTCNT